MRINLSQSIKKKNPNQKPKQKNKENQFSLSNFGFFTEEKACNLTWEKVSAAILFKKKKVMNDPQWGGRRVRAGWASRAARAGTGQGTGMQGSCLWLLASLSLCGVSERGWIIVPMEPPHPGQVRIHFYSLSSSDRNTGGRAKDRGRGEREAVSSICHYYRLYIQEES